MTKISLKIFNGRRGRCNLYFTKWKMDLLQRERHSRTYSERFMCFHLTEEWKICHWLRNQPISCHSNAIIVLWCWYELEKKYICKSISVETHAFSWIQLNWMLLSSHNWRDTNLEIRNIWADWHFATQKENHFDSRTHYFASEKHKISFACVLIHCSGI